MRSHTAYTTADGPWVSTAAFASRSRRALWSSEPAPCRTEITKSVADEHVDLTGLDGVVGVDVPERLQGEEQRVLVALELRPLVGGEGVLDGERVQAELLLDGGELLLARLVQADPDEVAGLGRELADPAELARREVVDDPLPLAVDGAVHDHGTTLDPAVRREALRAGPSGYAP